jgi:EAL domain-containing protein (putative c-di-GMP-specific phosphodiesterase class I)
MLRRLRRNPADAHGFVLVASDPLVIAAARDAARRIHPARPVQIVSGAEALFRLIGPGDPPRHLVLEVGTEGEALLSAARDRFSSTGVVVVARPGQRVPHGLRAVPAEGTRLAEALAMRNGVAAGGPQDPAALADGLARGEITVRFQPVVRLSDRRPMLVEALARWERAESAHGPADFVGVAEEAGLAMRLTLAVVARAVAELRATAGRRRGLRLAFNVPLAVLLQEDLPAQLRRILATAGFRPEDLLLELTENAVVRDTALLRRALHRLGRSGFGVMLDDLDLDDDRGELLDLPFVGVKLDRGLVAALPHSRRARHHVEQVVRQTHRQRRLVIAEGISDPLLWRCAAAAGCDLAQGFGVGRPIPPAALSAWFAAWAGAALHVE